MELKIKISERMYETIKNNDVVSLSELHELFDAIGNGRPVVASKNKIDNLLVLNEEEAKVFNLLSEEQRRVVGILLDNAAAKQTEEKDKPDDLVSEKEVNNHVEICHLMEDYLDRKLEKHEIDIISLYKTVERDKKILSGLSGVEKVIMKLFIQSLLD